MTPKQAKYLYFILTRSMPDLKALLFNQPYRYEERLSSEQAGILIGKLSSENADEEEIIAWVKDQIVLRMDISQ